MGLFLPLVAQKTGPAYVYPVQEEDEDEFGATCDPGALLSSFSNLFSSVFALLFGLQYLKDSFVCVFVETLYLNPIFTFHFDAPVRNLSAFMHKSLSSFAGVMI